MVKRERGAPIRFGRQLGPKVDNPKVAMALSGGGSHGAFAAGLVHTLFSRYLEQGKLPRVELVTGTSTGALVAGLLTELYGRFRDGRSPEKALAKLKRYYTQSTQNEVAVLPEGVGILYNLLCKKGVADIAPLRRLIEEGYVESYVVTALRSPDPVKLVVNFVDMVEGKLVQIDSDDPADLALMKDAIFASCAQPVVMTPAYVRYQGQDRWATDGGVREVIPIRPALRAGATHVFAVALNEPTIDPDETMTKQEERARKLFDRIDRGLSVMNDEVARMDERILRYAAYINRARDIFHAEGVDPALIKHALPPDPLAIDADPQQPGEQDPYEDKTFNRARVREIMLFRFKQQKLPSSSKFEPGEMRKMWDEGEEVANGHAQEIRDLLFAAGDFRR